MKLASLTATYYDNGDMTPYNFATDHVFVINSDLGNSCVTNFGDATSSAIGFAAWTPDGYKVKSDQPMQSVNCRSTVPYLDIYFRGSDGHPLAIPAGVTVTLVIHFFQ